MKEQINAYLALVNANNRSFIGSFNNMKSSFKTHWEIISFSCKTFSLIRLQC